MKLNRRRKTSRAVGQLYFTHCKWSVILWWFRVLLFYHPTFLEKKHESEIGRAVGQLYFTHCKWSVLLLLWRVFSERYWDIFRQHVFWRNPIPFFAMKNMNLNWRDEGSRPTLAHSLQLMCTTTHWRVYVRWEFWPFWAKFLHHLSWKTWICIEEMGQQKVNIISLIASDFLGKTHFWRAKLNLSIKKIALLKAPG